MALERRLTVMQADIALWRQNTAEAELKEMVPQHLRQLYEEQTGIDRLCAKRRQELWGARAVLHSIFGQAAPVMYSPGGRPYLGGSDLYISISHSAPYLAVALSPVPMGIDIEMVSARIETLSERFLSADEQAVVARTGRASGTVRTTAAWCAKEAAFKCLAHVSPVKVISEICLLDMSGHQALLQSTRSSGEQCRVDWCGHDSHLLAVAQML